jgi:hypothetical protein
MGLEHLILSLLKTHGGRIVVSVLAILVSTFFALLFVPNLADAQRLSKQHQSFMATVTDHRFSRGPHYFDVSYDLRYQFQLVRHGRIYEQTEKGPLARKELWSSLPKEKWQQAIRTGIVEVVYCPDDPAINVLQDDFSTNLNWVYGGCVVSVIALAASVAWLLFLTIIGPISRFTNPLPQPSLSVFER